MLQLGVAVEMGLGIMLAGIGIGAVLAGAAVFLRAFAAATSETKE